MRKLTNILHVRKRFETVRVVACCKFVLKLELRGPYAPSEWNAKIPCWKCVSVKLKLGFDETVLDSMLDSVRLWLVYSADVSQCQRNRLNLSCFVFDLYEEDSVNWEIYTSVHAFKWLFWPVQNHFGLTYEQKKNNHTGINDRMCIKKIRINTVNVSVYSIDKP